MPLFLFTGEEPYLLQQEYKKRKTSFIEKYGEHGFFSFNNESSDLSMIGSALMSGGMFTTKKLIVLRGIPLDSTSHNKLKTADIEALLDVLQQRLTKNDPETIVLCISYKPDKRTKPYKWFVEHSTVKEFAPLDDKQKALFIEQYLPGLLTASQKELLISSSGESLSRLAHECEKVKRYAFAHQLAHLSDDQLDSITYGIGELNNFTILDHLYTDPLGTISLIEHAKQQGEEPFQLLGMFYRGVKGALQIIHLTQHGVTESKTLASTLKMHPFVISKQMKLLSKTTAKKQQIITFFDELISLDMQIKTGILPIEGFRIALKTAIMRLV